MKSLNATVDRDISLIEEKEKALRDFLVDVDKRLKVYFRELEGREETEMKYASLSKKKPVTYGELGKNCFRRTTDMVQEKAPSAGAEGPTDTPVSVSDPKASSPSIDEQIHSLVRSGLSSAEIASRLGISISAVEFATALQERRNT
ncbi:MAG: hypothetical protein LBH42_05530 [Treponema sp.]|nr:hypothetical protein [Treponema sp.]